MEKSVVLNLHDFRGHLTPAQIEELKDIFAGRTSIEYFMLSEAGGPWLAGRTGETEPIFFKNKELFLRFNHASYGAQHGFIEGSYHYLSNEKVETIMIEVEWTPELKKRHIAASLFQPSQSGSQHRRRQFFFYLA